MLDRLVDAGNTVAVIEHNLDVIKYADWVIDLGPEGGDEGGRVIAEGTPEEVARVKESYTGQHLAKVLSAYLLAARGGERGARGGAVGRRVRAALGLQPSLSPQLRLQLSGGDVLACARRLRPRAPPELQRPREERDPQPQGRGGERHGGDAREAIATAPIATSATAASASTVASAGPSTRVPPIAAPSAPEPERAHAATASPRAAGGAAALRRRAPTTAGATAGRGRLRARRWMRRSPSTISVARSRSCSKHASIVRPNPWSSTATSSSQFASHDDTFRFDEPTRAQRPSATAVFAWSIAPFHSKIRTPASGSGR